MKFCYFLEISSIIRVFIFSERENVKQGKGFLYFFIFIGEKNWELAIFFFNLMS